MGVQLNGCLKLHVYPGTVHGFICKVSICCLSPTNTCRHMHVEFACVICSLCHVNQAYEEAAQGTENKEDGSDVKTSRHKNLPEIFLS